MVLSIPEDIPGISSTVTESGFSVSVTGSIESGQLENLSSAICSYSLVAGTDWQLQRGRENGETQAAQNRTLSLNQPSIVWNFPIDVGYKSTNAFGWPRLAINIRDGSRAIRGYGSIYIPTTPGTHIRYCKLFAPCSSTRVQGLVSTLTNEPPEFYDTRFTTASNGRQATRVASAGVVKVRICVKASGLEPLGYRIGG